MGRQRRYERFGTGPAAFATPAWPLICTLAACLTTGLLFPSLTPAARAQTSAEVSVAFVETGTSTAINEQTEPAGSHERLAFDVRVAVSQAQSVAVPFRLCFSGEASIGSSGDYVLRGAGGQGSTTLDGNGCVASEIAANDQAWVRALSLQGDNEDELTETIVAAVSEDPNAALPAGVTISSTAASATMRIRDNDPTTLVMMRASAQGTVIDENGGKGRIEIQLGRELQDGETVTAPIVFTLSGASDDGIHTHFSKGYGGKAVSTLTPRLPDYYMTLVFGAGARTGRVVITGAPNTSRNNVGIEVEYDTGAYAPSSTGMDGGITARQEDIVFAIANDDGLPSLNVSPGGAITEGGGATFTISKTPNVNPTDEKDLNVQLRVSQQGAYAPATSLGKKTIRLASNSAVYSVNTLNDNADELPGSVAVTLLPPASGSQFRYLVGVSTATVAVTDNDPTTVTLSAPTGDVTEGGTKTLTVSLSRALVSGESLTVPLSFGGAATFGTDYGLSASSPPPAGVSYANLASANLSTNPPTITFTGGAGASPSATISLSVTPDAHNETKESLTVALGTLTPSGMDGGARAAPGSLRFDALDANKPEVRVSRATAFVTEGTDARFTLTANVPPVADISVNLHIGATGDYVSGANTGNKQIQIKAGTTTATWDVPTLTDAVDELRGRITATVKPGTGYAPAKSGASATVETRDDDPTTVTLSVTKDWALERTTNAGLFRLTLGRFLAKGEQLTVPVSVSSASANNYRLLEASNSQGNLGSFDDFDSSTNTATFSSQDLSGDGIQSQFIYIAVEALSDGNKEDDAITVSVPASSSGGAPRLGVTNLDGGATGSRTGDGVIRILDSAVKNTVRVTGGAAVTEGTAAAFTVALDGVPRTDFQARVRLEQQGSFAAASQLVQRNITFFAAGPTSKRFTVATEDDNSDEAHGHIRATVVGNPAYNVAAAPDNEATVTVNDDDDPPLATPIAAFGSATATADEADGSTTASISLSLAAPKALTLNYALSGTATHGADYAISGVTGTSGTVSVAKDSTSVSIPVAITNDAVAEGDETIILALTDGDGYSVGTPGSIAIALTDDEPVVSVSGPSAAVEGTDLAFVVSMQAPAKTDLAVDVIVTQEGAFVTDEDLGEQEVIIKQGSASAILTCPTINDQIDEDDGLVTAVIKAGSGYTVAPSPADSAQVAVTDNDNPTPVVSISGGAAATEGEDATFDITAAPAPADNLSVELTVAQTGDFAEQGATGASKTVVVGASGAATYTVATVNDETDEPNGSITATLNDGTGYTVADSPNNAASVTVNDNDDPTPVISISGGAAVTEGGDATFNVTASPAPSANLSVELTIAQTGDFAEQGAIGANKTVVVGTSGAATYTVATANDEADEPNGNITATLNDGAGYAVADPPGNAALVAVNDDDEPLPVVSISGGAAVAEGDDATFNVTAAPAPADNLSVELTVAQTGDFAAQGAIGANKTVVIGASGAATYTVATANDNAAEPNGAITATLNDGTGYTVAEPPGNAASVAVNDNDTQTGTPEVTLSASPNPVSEGNSVTVTASISRALPGAVTIPLVLTAGSAEAGDYGSLASIEVPANETSGTGAITTADDSDTDDETFTVALGTLPAVVAAGTPSSVSLRIADGDTPIILPEVTLSASPNPVNEGDLVTVTATLSQSLTGAVTIPLVLTAGSAEAGDYGLLASIEIPANQTSGSDAIATVNDDDTDDETFTVALGALPGDIAAGTPASVALRITDNTSMPSIESLEDEIPTTFALEQNYPNPFNPSTTIEFALDKTQHVTLSVYDLLGQEVRTLVDSVQPAARYSVSFDASGLASGTYLYMLSTEKQVAVKTMALLK